MNATGCARIPRELCYWITFLSKALPPRSVGTFIELLVLLGILWVEVEFSTVEQN